MTTQCAVGEDSFAARPFTKGWLECNRGSLFDTLCEIMEEDGKLEPFTQEQIDEESAWLFEQAQKV